MPVKILHILTRAKAGGGAELNTLLTIKNSIYPAELLVGKDSNLNYINLFCTTARQEVFLVRNISLLKDVLVLIRIYRLIKKNGYTIVHTHQAKAGFIGRLAAHLAGVPIIIHGLHGSTFHSDQNIFIKKLYIYLEKLTGRYTDCFVSVGKDLRDRYLNSGIGNQGKYVIIRSGMDLDKFFKIKIKEKGQATIGMIASLEPRKGHIYALQAARRLPEVQFIFAGEGYLRQQLEKEAPQNVKFLGFRNDIENVLAKCDVIILTSLWEGLPQVLVQAAAASRPIVSFAIEGAKEVIKEGVNGFIVPIGDVDALVKKLIFLLSDLDRAKSMGNEGKTIINDDWLIKTMKNKTNELYVKLLKEKQLIKRD